MDSRALMLMTYVTWMQRAMMMSVLELQRIAMMATLVQMIHVSLRLACVRMSLIQIHVMTTMSVQLRTPAPMVYVLVKPKLLHVPKEMGAFPRVLRVILIPENVFRRPLGNVYTMVTTAIVITITVAMQAHATLTHVQAMIIVVMARSVRGLRVKTAINVFPSIRSIHLNMFAKTLIIAGQGYLVYKVNTKRV